MEDEDSNFETKKIRVKLDSLHENFKEQLAVNIIKELVKRIINYNAFLKGSIKEKLEKLDQIGKHYKRFNFLKGSLKEQLAGIGKKNFKL